MQVKNLNAYNRVNLVQTKLTYDPVTFKFHDDAADIIRRFWYDYYSFYYRDSDYQDATYQAPHKYNLRATDQWGYTPRADNESGDSQLIRSIQIFSFFQKTYAGCSLSVRLSQIIQILDGDPVLAGIQVRQQEKSRQTNHPCCRAGPPTHSDSIKQS